MNPVREEIMRAEHVTRMNQILATPVEMLRLIGWSLLGGADAEQVRAYLIEQSAELFAASTKQ